jgi:hypothetical protein
MAYWLFIEGSMYVDLILFGEGLNQFPPQMESSFRSLVLLPAAADLFFRLSLVITNGGGGYYVQFNLQKIWSMCFRRLLLHAVVEHTTPLLRSLLLVGTAIRFGSDVIPQ